MYHYYHHFTDVQTGADRGVSQLIAQDHSSGSQRPGTQSQVVWLTRQALTTLLKLPLLKRDLGEHHSRLSMNFFPVKVVCQSYPLLKRVFQDNLMQYSYEMNVHYTI